MTESFVLTKIFPGLPDTERGRPYVLKGDPKGKKFLYTLGMSVFIRDADDPGVSEIVTHHAKKATNACYSPSGFYIASGDVTGCIKIWDTVNPEHAIKYEYRPLAGSINDVSWSDDSKRLVVAGDGREKYATAFSWDTGTSVGELVGHTKTALSIDFRKSRPFAVITAGEDMSLIFYKGPPFKYLKTSRDHTNFINCVRFSPDGSHAASCGFDGKILIYSCDTFDKKLELVSHDGKAHSGGVYAISWSPCSKRLLSASGDRTCKIWNTESGACETTFEMGSDVMDQQLGCLWMNDHLISLALSGKLTFLDEKDPSKPKKVYLGHNKGIVSMLFNKDKSKLITGSYDGVLNYWDVSTGNCEAFKGEIVKNQATSIGYNDDTIYVARNGCIVQFASLSTLEFYSHIVKTESDPLCVCPLEPDVCLVGCISSILLIKDKKIVHSIQTPYQVVSICVDSTLKQIFFAGNDKTLRVLKCKEWEIEIDTEKSLKVDGDVTHLTFNHSCSKLLAATAYKNCHIIDVQSLKIDHSWAAHTNRVYWADWSPDDTLIATCGIDGSISVWKLSDINYRLEIRLAHRAYACVRVLWQDDKHIVSAGQQDCTIKFWELKI